MNSSGNTNISYCLRSQEMISHTIYNGIHITSMLLLTHRTFIDCIKYCTQKIICPVLHQSTSYHLQNKTAYTICTRISKLSSLNINLKLYLSQSLHLARILSTSSAISLASSLLFKNRCRLGFKTSLLQIKKLAFFSSQKHWLN